jgi:hypothetical protein
MTLKYENSFKTGDTIRSYDFPPLAGRRDCYVEGVVTAVDMECNNDGWGGYAAYVIEVTADSWDEPGKDNRGSTRVGKTVFVPMEVDFQEYDGRVVLVENAQ